MRALSEFCSRTSTALAHVGTVFNLRQPSVIALVTLSGVSKPINLVRDLARIRRLCAAADKMHRETTRLIDELSTEPSYAMSAAQSKSETPHKPATLRSRA
jgi:hypothetical protein